MTALLLPTKAAKALALQRLASMKKLYSIIMCHFLKLTFHITTGDAVFLLCLSITINDWKPVIKETFFINIRRDVGTSSCERFTHFQIFQIYAMTFSSISLKSTFVLRHFKLILSVSQKSVFDKEKLTLHIYSAEGLMVTSW